MRGIKVDTHSLILFEVFEKGAYLNTQYVLIDDEGSYSRINTLKVDMRLQESNIDL